MKNYNLYFVLMAFFAFCLGSCRSGFEHNVKGMEQLNKELLDEFGADAWYTNIELINSGGSDDLISIEVTKDPNSFKQEQWIQFHGFWEKKANVTVTVRGAEPRSFMFQLGKEVHLSRLGELMQQSRETLERERGVQEPQVLTAQVKSGNQMNTKEEGIYYSITIRGKNDQKNYNFVYNLDGSLRSLNE